MMRKTTPSPNNQPESFKGSRSAAVLALALVGAAVVIGVFVALTPLEDPDPATAVEASPTTPANLPGGQGLNLPSSGTGQPPRDIEISELKLPTEPAAIDVAALQKELETLAESLRSEYPDNAAALHIAAQIYAELKQTEQAQASWQACIALGPQLAGPYAGLSELQIAGGQEQAAIDLLEKAHAGKVRSSETLANLAQAHENLGELEEAQSVLLEATAEYPNQGTLWQALGRVQNQLREYEAAEASLRRALELDGPSEAALFTLVTSLVRQSKREEAAQVQEQLAALREEQRKTQVASAAPETEDANANSDSSFQAGYEQALAGIARRVLLAASSVAEQQREFDKAERLARRALEINPDALQGYMALIAALRNQNRLPEALAVHKLLLGKQPENMFNYINLASLAMQLGKSQLAKATLEQAAEREPNDFLVLSSLAKVYLAMGDFKEARLLAANLVTSHPSPESYLLLAATYEAVGDQTSAQAAVEKAKQEWPDHPLFQSPNPPAEMIPPSR